MKNIFMIFIYLFTTISIYAQTYEIKSPDEMLTLSFSIQDSQPIYSVKYSEVTMLEESPLGLKTTAGDFSRVLVVKETKENYIDKTYNQDRVKKSEIIYKANELVVTLENLESKLFEIVFRVSNNNIGLKYRIPQHDEIAICTIENELTGFNFPNNTTTFLTPQATPGIGWKNSKPSYEEKYVPDEPIGTPSKYGIGYTFPSLFHVGENGWVLLSETGVSSKYCGSKLSEGTTDGLYKISYPEPGENNGVGNANPSISLPGGTPWRTITVSNSLKPIVETTIPYDLVDPLYEASTDYKYGKSTWSWIMWQDRSMNYDDQVTFIDLAADLGFEYILVDALWDENIGYEKIPDLFKYAQSKNVDIFIWYNSNGYWNNAPQGPKNKMNTSIIRKKEMAWLKSLGVKGLKVDFFGGDKQETIKLYEDILSDANDYGLMVIFHGATLPRGWERMYPNYVGSEAVLASENLIFTQESNEEEAFSASLHPFVRNAVGAMEFGPVLLNKRLNRTNDDGKIRRTTDIFQIATSVIFQNPIQIMAVTPNNLYDSPKFVIDFIKNVPTTWDETIFIDGYPGKFVLLARRHKDRWILVGANALKTPLKLEIELPMFAGKKVTRYCDDDKLIPYTDKVKISVSGKTEISIQPNGGIVIDY